MYFLLLATVFVNGIFIGFLLSEYKYLKELIKVKTEEGKVIDDFRKQVQEIIAERIAEKKEQDEIVGDMKKQIEKFKEENKVK